MPREEETPSLVPAFDVTVHLVLNDFGKLGRSYLETDEEQADVETIIRNLIVGEYRGPKRVVAFNTDEGWARDISEDVAREILNRVDARSLSNGSLEFIWLHLVERSTAPA
jgi:hypothetical protein